MSAHSSKPQSFGEPFIILPSVESTNNYAMAALHAGLARHGTAYFALEQTAGKGQRGKEWKSTVGENIMLSVVTTPDQIFLEQPFLLSAAVSIACYDFIKMLTRLPVTIKWPNDLYINDRKAGGILIENVLRGNRWTHAIIGIGININQTQFDHNLKQATSLKLETQTHFELLDISKMLLQTIEKRYHQIQQNPKGLLEDYNRQLFKRNEVVQFRRDGKIFTAKIIEVSASGALLTDQGTLNHGEQEWLLI